MAKGNRRAIVTYLREEEALLVEKRANNAGMSISAYVAGVLLSTVVNDDDVLDEVMVSVSQAAVHLGKSRFTVYRMINNGEFDGEYVTYEGHRGTYIKLSAVRGYIERYTKKNKTKTSDGCMSAKEVADAIYASKPSVYRWIEKGELKASKSITGKWRINPTDLKEFLEQKGYHLPKEA